MNTQTIIKDIEDHKRLAIKLVELNKDMDLQIKFVGMNNKILFNTLFLCKRTTNNEQK